MKQLLSITLIVVLFSCSKDNSGPQSGSSTTGVSGSLARFAVTNEHLYAVTNSGLKVFDVFSSGTPMEGREIALGFGIETIFPKGNNLFIGTQTGMKIFDASRPEAPVQLSDYRHIRSCDPVVANDKYAFVTLRTEETQCPRGVNELQVIDVSKLNEPRMIRSYPGSRPFGLALDGNKLFVCDMGVNVYEVSDPGKLELKNKIPVDALDVIAHEGILMVIGRNGLYQYDYSTDNLTLLSHIPTL